MASQFPAPPVITDDGDTSWLQPQQFPAAPPANGGGYWLPQIAQGIWNSLKSGATLPGDVATGKASMVDPATQQRVGDMAGLVTLGAGALPAEENSLRMGMGSIQDIHDKWAPKGVKLDLSQSGNGPLNLNRIVVPPDQRGQGVGSAVMGDITQHADDIGKTVTLTPSTDFGGSSVNRLANFYKRFGFVNNSGRNKDFSISDSMYRVPTQPEPTPPFPAAPQATEALSPPPPSIKAYHGSPHSFDKFSTDAIGTGEGAQAYGHGLYFADSEGVAKAYREGLAGKPQPATMHWDGKPAFDQTLNSDFDPTIRNGIYELHARLSPYADPSNPQLIERTKANLNNTIKNFETGSIPMEPRPYQDAKDAQAVINDPRFSVTPAATPGHMYQVDINADPAHMLDWDKPLSEQPQSVQDAYNARVAPGLTTREVGNNPNLGPLFDVIHPNGGSIGTFTKDNLQDVLSNPAKYVPTKGQDFYNDLARQSVNGDWGPPGDFAHSMASNQLRDAGIPGIRYLDQGSRGAGTGSSNYVVFNDAIVNILKKYGLAGLGGAAGAGAMMNQPQPAQAGQFPAPPPY